MALAAHLALYWCMIAKMQLRFEDTTMANNLHISYDLNNPGQNYEAVTEAIKATGEWAKIQKSYWYSNSKLTAQQAVSAIWKVMDKNDSLYVVDATNNQASWQGVSDEVAKFIIDRWLK